MAYLYSLYLVLISKLGLMAAESGDETFPNKEEEEEDSSDN
uniref:Uncharacterized protein n=1 Tax=Rhodnius prolixus TaxID=13249 RepID=T1HNR0_RHOPR